MYLSCRINLPSLSSNSSLLTRGLFFSIGSSAPSHTANVAPRCRHRRLAVELVFVGTSCWHRTLQYRAHNQQRRRRRQTQGSEEAADHRIDILLSLSARPAIKIRRRRGQRRTFASGPLFRCHWRVKLCLLLRKPAKTGLSKSRRLSRPMTPGMRMTFWAK